MKNIYLDVCCLNRAFDDQRQHRIHLETEAIIIILEHLEKHDWKWYSSEIIEYEIEQTPDNERKRKVKMINENAHEILKAGEREILYAKELEKTGINAFDALHIACAEKNGIDIFLTTDDNLIKKVKRIKLKMDVKNPLEWVKEIMEDEH